VASANGIDALVAEVVELKARLHAAETVAFIADRLLVARVVSQGVILSELRDALKTWERSRQPAPAVYPLLKD
jgi:hypothetical protein